MVGSSGIVGIDFVRFDFSEFDFVGFDGKKSGVVGYYSTDFDEFDGSAGCVNFDGANVDFGGLSNFADSWNYVEFGRDLKKWWANFEKNCAEKRRVDHLNCVDYTGWFC